MQRRLDLRGTIIPFSLLKVCQVFKLMDIGEILEVVWSDPAIREDLIKVLPAASYDLISLDEIKDEPSAYKLTLLKKQL